MSYKDAGRWLVTAAVGAMLAAAPATALAAQANGFGVGNRAFNNRAVPATFETTDNSQMSKYKKIDDDDDDGGDWDFGFGYGGGPWWGGWYGPPYGGWGPSQYYYYYPARQHKPKKGQVKIETSRKNAKVYINGGYAGKVKQAHKFQLKPGRYEVAIRTANGQNYDTNVYVLRGRTVHVRPDFRAERRASS